MRRWFLKGFRFLVPMTFTAWIWPGAAMAADTAATIQSPVPFQVVQRQGFVPTRAHEHEPGGPALGHADLPIRWEWNGRGDVEARAILQAGAYGKSFDWTKLTATHDGRFGSAKLRVGAGGWYRLELRWNAPGQTAIIAAVDPVGVGEVIVVAGQSYAAGANDELLKVADPMKRVVALNTRTKAWNVANDPPNAGEGGTIWPALGDALVPILRVPVGFVNVASGGTASRQWLPAEKLFSNLAVAGKDLGRFRMVLWQQGESDVIAGVTTEKYTTNLVAIRTALAKEWGFQPPWLLAKSTLHPTVYKKPVEEGRIRQAIDGLWTMPGFRPGPDTDILAGENRGGRGTRRHFTGIGQRRAAMMWSVDVLNEINLGLDPK